MQATSEQRNEYEWIVSNVRSFFSAIPVDQDFMLISGGAEGVDSLAQALALWSTIFKPDYKRFGSKRAPLERNKLIVTVAVVLESRDVAHRRAREGRRQAGVRSRDAGREVDVKDTPDVRELQRTHPVNRARPPPIKPPKPLPIDDEGTPVTGRELAMVVGAIVFGLSLVVTFAWCCAQGPKELVPSTAPASSAEGR